jgi:hypothetical protein
VAVRLESGANSTAAAKLPRYFHRLSDRAQRIYLQSAAIERFDFAPRRTTIQLTASLLLALESGAPTPVQRSAQLLLDELSRLSAIGGVRLQVRSVRPHNSTGELHGIFYPRASSERHINPYEFSSGASGGPLIVLWMRTAQRHEIVKPKTFLRTLMHEFAHYLDYALLQLGDSPHTPGFFKRESFLVRMLTQPTPPDEL